MTPEERKLVMELFDRLATLEDAERDPEAEDLIRDGMRQAPNAVYALVQTVLLQDEALKRANARIREFEGGADAPARDTSFLAGMRDRLSGARPSRGSVPSVRPDAGPPPPPSGMSPAWRTGGQPVAPADAVPAPSAPMGMGGSFLGTAASAAAGVIGGALLLDGIRSMMGHHSGAHAAFDPSSSGSSPWSTERSGGGLAHEAGLDDIGQGLGASPARDSAHGLLDDSGNEREEIEGSDDEDADDIDDDGPFDVDDGDFSDQ
jgi:hypothetical protein